MSERKAPCGTISGPAMDTTWQTPPELLEPLAAYWGGAIPFDAATSASNPAKALAFLTPEQDGLSAAWPRNVWINPPYGRVLRKWLAKITVEAGANGVEVISLLPCARWEQGYLQFALGPANALCLIRKRVAFIRPSTGDRVGGNPYANMFVGWNVDLDRFAACFGVLGGCFALRSIAACPAFTAPRPCDLARPVDDPAQGTLFA